jgi:hypothetical protein
MCEDQRPRNVFSAVTLRVFDALVASVARSFRTKPNDVSNTSPMLAALSVIIDLSREFVIARDEAFRERLEFRGLKLPT